jgi:group I intron endonuclease
MEKIYTIYKATNKINNKSYIGFDSSWPARKSGHKSRCKNKNTNYKFYKAIAKYGWDNFEWIAIYQSKNYEHTYKTMESHFIKEYNSFENGYNMTTGGDGVNGCKTSGAPKGRIPWNKGKKGLQKVSEETRLKMKKSSARKGKPAYNKGIPMSAAAKEKASKSISNARKLKFWSTKKSPGDSILS